MAAALAVGGLAIGVIGSRDRASVDTSVVAATEVAGHGIRSATDAGTRLTLPAPVYLEGSPVGAPGDGSAEESTTTAAAAEPAPTTAAPQAKAPDRSNDRANGHAYDLHNYLDHVKPALGAQMLAPGQATHGGYEWVGPTTIQARSPITGLRPVIEQAITDITNRRGGESGRQLESKIARRLTDLNDWENLSRETQAKMILLSGINIEAMSKKEREHHVNHLLHSPLPFGDIEEILTPDVTIDLGYTHTLDKGWTNVEDQGNGVFRIWMVSNNNNGSHTGHSLGSFRVQLPPGTSVREAREIGNRMVVHNNDNNRLLLDVAARNILYGQTPLLDFSQPPASTTTTAPPTDTTAPAETTSPTGPPPDDPGAPATTVPSTVPPPSSDTMPATTVVPADTTPPTTASTVSSTTAPGGHNH